VPIATVFLLLKQKLLLCAQDSEPNPFHLAAAVGGERMIKSLAEALGPTKTLAYLKKKDGLGQTPLHLAASSGRLGAVQGLIEAGESGTSDLLFSQNVRQSLESILKA
jgi:ankyrin repeat protein